MKKLLAGLVAVVLLASSLSGCGIGSTNENKKDSGTWELTYVLDEFKDPTDEWCITNTKYFQGTFSNSATTDAKLYAKVFINEDIFAIQLLKYGDMVVKNSGSKKQLYEIMVKWEDGTKSKFYEYMPAGEDRIVFQSPDDYYITQRVKTNAEISFHISEGGNSVTSYLFTIKSDNFAELYNEATGVVEESSNTNNETQALEKSAIEIVQDSYDEALAVAKQKGADQNYSYLLLRKEVQDLLSKTEFDPEASAEIFNTTVTADNVQQKGADLLTYVLEEDQDYLSALMKRFKQTEYVKGTIDVSSVDIAVEDIQALLDELSIRPETLGRILAMLDIYDFSWLSSDSGKFLQFTDTGFTYKWSAVGDYKLTLE